LVSLALLGLHQLLPYIMLLFPKYHRLAFCLIEGNKGQPDQQARQVP
jgi:hypothetical protein